MVWVRLNRSIMLLNALIFFSLGSCDTLVFKNELPEILGVNKIEIVANEVIADISSTFGEGYGMEVYELSESTVQAFLNMTSKTLPDKGEKWQKHDWSKVPIDNSFSEVLDVALGYYNRDKDLETHLNAIKKMLVQGNAYYSFYYKPDRDNPQNVQLFVLDIQKKKLYAIDSNI